MRRGASAFQKRSDSFHHPHFCSRRRLQSCVSGCSFVFYIKLETSRAVEHLCRATGIESSQGSVGEARRKVAKVRESAFSFSKRIFYLNVFIGGEVFLSSEEADEFDPDVNFPSSQEVHTVNMGLADRILPLPKKMNTSGF